MGSFLSHPGGVWGLVKATTRVRKGGRSFLSHPGAFGVTRNHMPLLFPITVLTIIDCSVQCVVVTGSPEASVSELIHVCALCTN